MAIKLSQGFQITGPNVIDTRIVLTKEQMRNTDDRVMPMKYFALCSDDDNIYIYNKNNVPNDETGKFISLENHSVNIDNKSITTTEDEKIELNGYSEAEIGQIPSKEEEGILWRDPDTALEDIDIYAVIDN